MADRNSKQNVVGHYGLHESSGLWWLEQETGGVNARNIKTKSPFVVKPTRGASCPHSISLVDGELSDSERATFDKLFLDPLCKLFFPIPTSGEDRIFFVPEQQIERSSKLMSLSQLCSPARSASPMAWTLVPGDSRRENSSTNILPYMVRYADAKWMATKGSNLIQYFASGIRPLIITGSTDTVLPPLIKRADTKVLDELEPKTLHEFNLQETGGRICRAWMRGEWE